MRNFLSILDMPRYEAGQVLLRAKEMKDTDFRSKLLDGKTFLLIFEKASTRTRVSFEVAVRHLGGEAVFIAGRDSQLGRSEPLEDTARVLSRYADGLIIRTFGQDRLEYFTNYGDIPVVNALTDMYHPCQVMSDMLTIYERTPNLKDVHVAWVGDGNNMAHSWINAAVHFPFYLTLAFPPGYEPEGDVIRRALQMGAKINMTHDPVEAVKGAHYVNTDVWASMGQEEEQKKREMAFMKYQVNEELLSHADKDCKLMHCLPAHRGEEVSEALFESDASIVFDQAENRLHMQKAILEWVYQGIKVDMDSLVDVVAEVPFVPNVHTP
ncbi:MAG: ornithine carbamoyltransferase [Desulfovibrio sp.]